MAITQEEHLDVLLVGSGSAGLMAALWLAIYNSRILTTASPSSPSTKPITYRALERRSGPMTIGQADGVQCRTVEIFESLDLSEDLLREAYHVLEVAFWSYSPEASSNGERRGIVRTNRAADTAKGLSHMPHLILNQARINGLLLEKARKLGGREIDYGWTVKSVAVDETLAGLKGSDAQRYPCTVVAVRDDGVEKVFRTKYVLVSACPSPLLAFSRLTDRV
jgi:phenol 2-monooxygenase (NADPH)